MDMTHNEIIEILKIVVCAEHLPLYLHCLDGTHITGHVLMCLRRLQLWEKEAIFFEFRRFIPSTVIEKEEKEFITAFKEIDFIFPDNSCEWVWPLQQRQIRLGLNHKKQQRENSAHSKDSSDWDKGNKGLDGLFLEHQRDHMKADRSLSYIMHALNLEGVEERLRQGGMQQKESFPSPDLIYG